MLSPFPPALGPVGPSSALAVIDSRAFPGFGWVRLGRKQPHRKVPSSKGRVRWTSSVARSTKQASREKLPESMQLDHDSRAEYAFSRNGQVNLSAMLSKEGKPTTTSTLGEIARLAKIAHPEARWLALAFILLAVSSVITMSVPYSMGKMLDVAAKAADDDVRILGLAPNHFLIALAGVLTVGCVAGFGKTVLLRVVGERVVAKLRSRLYRRTLIQDAEFFDANRVGDLLSRLTSDATIVGRSITQNLSEGFSSLFVSIAGFSIMIWTSPKLTAMLLLMIPPGFLGAVVYGTAVKNISRLTQKNLGALSRIAEERLGGIRTTQAFVGESLEIRRYNTQIRDVVAVGVKEARVNAAFGTLANWAGDIIVVGILVIGGSFVRSGAMSVGDLTSFMMYTVYTGAGLLGLGSFYSELMKGVGAAGRLFELQDRQPSTYPSVGKPAKSAQAAIEFKDVSFAYPTRPANDIFNGLSFSIPSGANVCIVGPSGSGKSTIGALLLCFYTPRSGSITINGVDLREMNAKSLRRRIGMVSQEPVLFSGTIADNISYGMPSASRSDIITAARQAFCSFIDDLPEGLDTQVGARGLQLSGGQKQRIAIARALIKDPDIVILDEATSALDAESEASVNKALAGLLQGRSTTISIAHRLSTMKRSEQIIVLDKEGKAVEVGSYKELSADKESAFSQLIDQQMHDKPLASGLPCHQGALGEEDEEDGEIQASMESKNESEYSVAK
jgi:putative ABC transport system ATP-binding protein